ncbi:hypothetical protein KDI_29470 [Dictyobacter arantiisoli]|uniref:Uncharacterized protein n=1 Tax=Dictyobacter arantiisoli TaxID=2014874 RepID=A0A5A5TE76_9CHLR|nr:hypothetical protein KDI_29470 [Dictyobacter arantiisoli]
MGTPQTPAKGWPPFAIPPEKPYVRTYEAAFGAFLKNIIIFCSRAQATDKRLITLSEGWAFCLFKISFKISKYQD